MQPDSAIDPADGPDSGGPSGEPDGGPGDEPVDGLDSGSDDNDTEAASPEQQARQAYDKAVRLLGARDHSSFELRRKLQQRGFASAAIDTAFAELISARYLDDQRFAELYAEQRARRHYGPRAIYRKLAERGIDGSAASVAVDGLMIDWQEHAFDTLVSRFSEQDIVSTENRIQARIARYLQSRGYASGDSLRAVQQARQQIVQRAAREPW